MALSERISIITKLHAKKSNALSNFTKGIFFKTTNTTRFRIFHFVMKITILLVKFQFCLSLQILWLIIDLFLFFLNLHHRKIYFLHLLIPLKSSFRKTLVLSKYFFIWCFWLILFSSFISQYLLRWNSIHYLCLHWEHSTSFVLLYNFLIDSPFRWDLTFNSSFSF